MKVTTESTFSEILERFSQEIEKVKVSRSLTLQEKSSKLDELREDMTNLCLLTFKDEYLLLLKESGILQRLSHILERLSHLLIDRQIAFNVFQELNVLQIVEANEVTHAPFVESELISTTLFNLKKGEEHFDLVVGYLSRPSINEKLQLAYQLFKS